jgi:transcriptional regulator with XRE-family HTH domain
MNQGPARERAGGVCNVRDARLGPGLGATIRRLREERGWLQEELAARAGITQAQVSRLESGEQRDPRWSTLEGLARAFGLSLDALTGRSGDHRAPGELALDSRTTRYPDTEARIEALLRPAIA